jgi:hypothetical protein
MADGGERSEESGVEGLTHPRCWKLVSSEPGKGRACERPKGHHGEHTSVALDGDWIILPGPESGIMDASQMTPALQRAYQGFVRMHDRMNILTAFVGEKYRRETEAGLHMRFTDNIDAAIYYMGLERRTPRWMKRMFSIF